MNIFLQVFRGMVISLSFPAYLFYYFHYRCLKGLLNTYVRGLFDKEYVSERRDMFFARWSFLLVLYYMWVLYKPLGFMERDTHYQTILTEYRGYFVMLHLIEKWVSSFALAAILFVLLDELFLKRFLIGMRPATIDTLKSKYRNQGMKRKKIFVGVELESRKPVYISTKSRVMHTCCVGSPGVGKSDSLIFPWVFQDMRGGRGAVVIEGKGSIDLGVKLFTYHVRENPCKQPFFIVNLADPEHSPTYCPILRGTAGEIKDRIMGAFTWSESFYKNESSMVLSIILMCVEAVGKKIHFRDLYYLLTDLRALQYLYEMLPDGSHKIQLQNKVIMDFKNVQKNCSGLINNLYMFAHGGLSSMVNTYTPDIDLFDVYDNNKVVYFSLPTNLLGETAEAFGKMLLMDLKSVSGYIEQKIPKAKRQFFPVFIDEFAEFASKPFITWLNKSRSSMVSVHLAFQSFGDLKAVSESFAMQIIDNTNIKVVFRVNDADTAESFSKQLGTHAVVKETEQIDKHLLLSNEGEKGSLREAEEFFVHPNILKNDLRLGQAFVFMKHPHLYHSIVETDFFPDLDTYEIYEFERGDVAGADNGLHLDEVLKRDTVDDEFVRCSGSPENSDLESGDASPTIEEDHLNGSQMEKVKFQSVI